MREDEVVKSPLRRAFFKTRFNPARIVNLCFIVVLICSTVLTWREVRVMEGAWVASQRNALNNVANVVDRQLQVSVDRLLFFRNGMQEALRTPLGLAVLHSVQGEFEDDRTQPYWRIIRDTRRTLPLYGVSDALVSATPGLKRDIPLLHNELAAALELGYLFRLSESSAVVPRRAAYVSRAGFYMSTVAAQESEEIIHRYNRMLARPWFTSQSERQNRARGVRWFSESVNGDALVTASVPLDYQRYWYGVLIMSFAVDTLYERLVETRQQDDSGEYQLYDAHFALLTRSTPPGVQSQTFTPEQKAALQRAIRNSATGGLRMGTRYINWEKLRHFDGALVRIQTLREGIRGDFGSISIALGILWLLFTTMLLVSWAVIRRMVSNMLSLQQTLQWQAWFDPLTRLLNRGALFERASLLTAEYGARKEPFSVIQLDLDHFKSINDRFGHQAGDRVLSHAAALISKSVRAQDVAGRVGGEEFCILLPGATLAEAEQVAEKMRQRIAGKEILVRKGKSLRISASLGVSCSDESGSYAFDYLQSVADSRLYSAKRRGRNQVCSDDASSMPNS